MNSFKIKNWNHLFLIAMVLSTSACSLRDRNQGPQVSVSLPSDWVAAVANKRFSTMATSSTSPFETPTSIEQLNCFAINVKGPGIQPDARFGCTDPSRGPSLVAGFVPVTQSTLDVMVPAGAGRVIQLIGVQSTIGCPDLNTLLANNGSDSFKDQIGEPYLLGEATVDVFDDVGVSIVALLDTTQKAFDGCRSEESSTGGNTSSGGTSGGGTGGATNSIHVGVIAGVANVMQGACSKFHVSVSSSGAAAPSLYFNSSISNGTVGIYRTSACAAADLITSSNPISFAAADFFEEVYVKVTPNSGQSLLNSTFSITPVPQSGTWNVFGPTFTVVDQRFAIDSTTQTNGSLNSCLPIGIQLQNQNGTPLNLYGQNFMMTVETSQGAASTAQLFTDNASCNNSGSAISFVARTDNYSSRIRHEYDLTGAAGTLATYYIKASAIENGFISVSKSGTQPAGVGYSFSSSTYSGGTTTSYPLPNLVSPSTSSFTTSSDVVVSGNCQIGFTVYLNRINPTPATSISTFCANGTFSFNLSGTAGTTYYYDLKQGNGTQFSGNYSFVWTKSGSTGSNVGGAYTCQGCSSVSGNNYTIPLATSVYMTPNSVVGATMNNCTFSTVLPSGLYGNYGSCTITGNATTAGTSSVTITGTVGGNTTPVTITLTIENGP